MASGYKFPILDSTGTATSTVVDFDDMFVRKELWLDSGLWACGYNAYGELGNNNRTYYSTPIQVGSLSNWRQVTGLNVGFAAVKTDGTLWAWGWNAYGQIGNNNITNYSSPVQVGALADWKQISSSDGSMLAVKTDGTLWAWGYNLYGQLANNNNVNYSSPIQIGALTNWKSVSTGYVSTGAQFAIKTDGTLWAWGYNFYGELGNGNTANYSSPIQIGALTDWKYLSTAAESTAAIKTDGTLWTWGLNNFGQCGNNTNGTGYSSPIQIGTLTNWKQVCVSNNWVAAVKTDGTLWAWGQNNNSQFNDSTQAYSSPIQVGSLATWKFVHAYFNSVYVIKTDGTLWACGYNNYGQLGIGTTASSNILTQVGTSNSWKQIAGSAFAVAGIQSPDLP